MVFELCQLYLYKKGFLWKVFIQFLNLLLCLFFNTLKLVPKDLFLKAVKTFLKNLKPLEKKVKKKINF